ncbi:hypothetical protein VPHK373_0010 [Vibrio phage K373]
MKMSDVFCLPMVQGSIVLMSNDHRYVIEFDASDSNYGEQIDHVAHAINNHDRMVEEIAELKGKLLEHKEFNELMHSMPTDWTIKRSIELHKETEKLLAKLNQEGEE